MANRSPKGAPRIVLEDDIPPPDNRKNPHIYPFHKMKVGQSFSMSNDNTNSVRVAAYWYGKRHGMKFVTRKEGPYQVRVWRTK